MNIHLFCPNTPLLESMQRHLHVRSDTATTASLCFGAARVGSSSFGSIFLMIRAGLPATTWKAGTSLVTTLPAPMVAPRPILIPGQTVTLPPNQQSSPIVIGLPSSGPLIPLRRKGSRGCVAAKNEQFGPMRVREPIVIKQVSRNVQLKLI
jgi:hypothetical protein